MTPRIEQIAAKVKASGHPLSACLSNLFADGSTHTVWFDRLTPEEVIELRRVLGESVVALTPAQHRAIAEAEAGATSRRSRRR